MATFNLTITYPDGAAGSALINALKAYHGVTTNPQVVEALRQVVISHVRGVKQSVDQQAAIAAIPAPDVT